MQHQAKHRALGRHRPTQELHRASVLTARRRHAILTAALIAGVGVVGASAAGQAQAKAAPVTSPLPQAPEAATASSPSATSSSSAASSSSATAADSVVIPPTIETGTLAWVTPARKSRPLAGKATITAQWVNPLPQGAVTSCFGERWGRLHAGVDLATVEGTPILAAGAGVVVRTGPAGGYGNAVLIDHGNGFLTHYGHLAAITVTAGQHVGAGQQIGNEGSTGHSTGPHLHFEVHQGSYQNPIEPTQWMHEHGVDVRGCVPLTDPAPPTNN